MRAHHDATNIQPIGLARDGVTHLLSGGISDHTTRGYSSPTKLRHGRVCALACLVCGLEAEAVPAPGDVPVADSRDPGTDTQGLSNKEVAARAFIGTNSVKTYIRSAY